MKTAIFPGSFDPITKGHEDILRRSESLFDWIYICLGVHDGKKYLFDLDTRLRWIEAVASQFPRMEALAYEGLTVDLCRRLEARYVIRGIRNEADFRYENDIAQINKILNPSIETIFLISLPEFSNVSSSIIRDIYKNEGDYHRFLPDCITL